MPTSDSEISIVEALRSKTEESDIKLYLKSTMGGYTKNSVLEYLNLLRKQQQSMAETFSHNQQLLYDEKENLKKTNDALKTRLLQIESEYQVLSQSLRLHELGDEEITAYDIAALKGKISALEDELNRGEIEKSRLEKQIDLQNNTIEDYSLKLKQAEQEKLSIRELLKAEMTKSKNLDILNSKLSGTIEEKDDEIKFLNALVNEGQLAKLNEKINELTEQLSSQAQMLVSYNKERDLLEQRIDILNSENAALNAQNTHMSNNISDYNVMIEKLSAANMVLTEKLESEYKETISLIKEKSSIMMDKLSANAKLDAANSKIIVLELQHNKKIDSQNADANYLCLRQTEDAVTVNS